MTNIKRALCFLIGHKWVGWWNAYASGVRCLRCRKSEKLYEQVPMMLRKQAD